jgi:GT2 family glycosyltransferase
MGTKLSTSSSPRVSVIITAYRHAAYIAQALESVFSQTYKDYEVIVVNDDSPDNTEEVLKPYLDSNRIRYYRQNHQGVAAARNLGWNKARGQYIAFLDDDDIWPPDKLEWQVSCLDQSSALAIVGLRQNFTTQPIHFATNASGKYKNLKLINFYKANPIGSPGQTLVRRSALETIGGFDPTIWGVDDLDLWIRISKVGPLEMHQKPSLHYRLHPANASANRTAMLNNLQKVLKKNLDGCEGLTHLRLSLEANRFIFRSGGKIFVRDAIQHCFEGRAKEGAATMASAFKLIGWKFLQDPRLFASFCSTLASAIINCLRTKIST